MIALWWTALIAPSVLGILALCRWPATTPRWLWLCCLPALVAAAWPPPEVQPLLWPGAHWGLDEMRRGFLAFTGAVWVAATLFAGRDNPETPYDRWFWLAWLLTFTGNFLLIISLDGAGFYVGYSVMSLSAYMLIVHSRDSPRRKGGRLYLQLAVISELLIFAGLMLRLEESAFALALPQWQPETTVPTTAVLLLAGFGIKLGIWPLHLWIPFAYFAARPVVCTVLSGAMMATALLGLWTFLPEQSPLLANWSNWLLAIAVFSALYGVAIGLPQKDARKVLAYSSVSQAGYLLAIVAMAWHQPAQRDQWGVLVLMFAAHHGLAKGALFLGAGLAAARRLRPFHWLLMAAPALALAGLPLTTGAVVKAMLEKGIGESVYQSWGALMPLGSLATALLVLRALWRMYRSQPETDDRTPTDGKLLAWIFLSLMAVTLPWAWPAMAEPLQHSLALKKVLSATGVVLLALAISIIGYRLRFDPPRMAWYQHPGMIFSTKLKVLIENAFIPVPVISPDREKWRQRERRWNYFWTRRNAVGFTALTLGVLLLIGWIWWL